MPTTARLRAGLHVVRRDAASVQVGLDPPRRVILPADDQHLQLLEVLRHGGPVNDLTTAQARALRDLRVVGLLDEPAAPGLSRGSTPEAGVVALLDHGLGEGVAQLGRLLIAAGVDVRDAIQGVGSRPSRPSSPPDLVVACAAAPLPRAVVDPWLAEGTPHLLLGGTGRPGSLRIGPLVEPGLTACLRCVDAAEATGDPRRPLLVEQLATRPAAPLAPMTLALAVAWAARDVAAFLSGGPASTWSATVDIDEAPGSAPAAHAWARHPECGCCWDELPF